MKSHLWPFQQVSVGVGSDTIDVEVRPIKTMRSFAVEAKPTIVHRGYQTDKGYQKDIGVSTIREQTVQKAVNTTPLTTFPAATNTDTVKLTSAATGTELKIFQAMDQVRNVASNTPVVQKYSFGVNTDEEPKIQTHDRAIATQKEFSYNKGVNTDPPRVSHMGVGNQDVHKSLLPEKPPVRHAAVGIRPHLADRGVGDGMISHSDVYGDATQREDDQVHQVQESMVQAQKVVTTKATSRRYGFNENDNNNLSRYGLEREEDRLTTRSSPERTERITTRSSPERAGGSSSRYTVETHTTRNYGLGPGRTETTRTTKSYCSGVEPVSKSTTEYSSSKSYGSSIEPASKTTTEYSTSKGYGIEPVSKTTTEYSSSKSYGSSMEPVRKTTTEYSTSGIKSSSSPGDDDDDVSGGYLARYGAKSGVGSGGGSYSRTTTTTTKTSRSSSGGGTTEVTTDDDAGKGLYGSITTTTTSKTSSGRGGTTGGSSWSSSGGISRSGTTSGKYEYLAESGSRDGSAGGQQVEYVTDASGNTKMRVIRSVETTYVGEKPVHQSSNVVIQDDGSGSEDSTGTVRRVMKSEQEMPERDVSPGSFRRITKSSTQESRSEPQTRTITKEYSSSSSPQNLHGRTVTVTETHIERRRGDGFDGSESPTRDKPKSILKEPGSQSPNIKKKEIKFAEGTVGG